MVVRLFLCCPVLVTCDSLPCLSSLNLSDHPVDHAFLFFSKKLAIFAPKCSATAAGTKKVIEARKQKLVCWLLLDISNVVQHDVM